MAKLLLSPAKRACTVTLLMLTPMVMKLAAHEALAAPVILVPSVSVSEEYNDNVFFTKQHVEDYITSVSPGVTLQYQRPTLTTALSGSTSAQFFARHTGQDSLAQTQSGQLTLSYRASPRLTMSVADGVTRVGATRTGSVTIASEPAPAEQPPPSQAASTLLPRGAALSNYFSAQGTYLLSRRWTGNLGYSNAFSDFTNPGGRNVTHGATLSVGYSWNPLLSFAATYSYSRFSLNRGTDAESHSATLGTGYQAAPTWSANASAGVFVNRPLGSGGDSTATGTGFTGSAVLTRSFERASASVGGGQSVTPSAGVGGLSVTRYAFLRGQMQLLRSLSGWAGGSYSDFDTSQTSFRVLELSAGVTYPLWSFITAGLTYSYRQRESGQSVPGVLDAGTVDGNLVLLYLSSSYPLWQGDL